MRRRRRDAHVRAALATAEYLDGWIGAGRPDAWEVGAGDTEPKAMPASHKVGSAGEPDL